MKMTGSPLKAVIIFLLCSSSIMGLTHPGVYNNAAELNFIRTQVRAGAEPWASAYSKMLTEATTKGKVYASLGWEPTPFATVQRGGAGNVEYYIDALAAYTHSLIWIITGKKEHAQKAIEILNAWSSTFRNVTVVGSYNKASHKLVTGWVGGTYAAAAELLRYSNAGWSTAEIERCEAFVNRMYDIIKSGDPKKNGNWDASMIRSMLAIAVFRDDMTQWNHASAYLFKKSSNGSLPGYIKPSGESQETCRDHHHAQMGIGELVQACEIGWKQGEDWYGYQDNLLAKGCEYTAKVLNGVPQSSGCGSQSCPGCIVYPFWEMAVNHYANRAKVAVPYSEKCAEKIRPSDNWWSSMFAWQTLTHYGLPPLPKGYSEGSVAVIPSRVPNRAAGIVPDQQEWRAIGPMRVAPARSFSMSGLFTTRGRRIIREYDIGNHAVNSRVIIVAPEITR